MHGNETSGAEAKPALASTAILFLFGSLGCFYSLIAVVDPYL